MNYEFNGILYDVLHINSKNYKKYQKWLNKIELCDREVIDKSLEDIELSSLEDEGFHGFFISHNGFKNILAFVILDFNCENSSHKIDFAEYGLNIENCVELSLFCSNQSIRIPKLATSFLQSVLENSKFIKPNCNTVVGIPANRNLKKLLEFYIGYLNFEMVKQTSKFTVIKRNIHVDRPVYIETDSQELLDKENIDPIRVLPSAYKISPNKATVLQSRQFNGGVSKKYKKTRQKNKNYTFRNYLFK